uniref:Uncharacterized protein n=1 Tax=Anguilla anguilla TaxID=7936 RepID=A0A0E9WH41_ANGAN
MLTFIYVTGKLSPAFFPPSHCQPLMTTFGAKVLYLIQIFTHFQFQIKSIYIYINIH